MTEGGGAFGDCADLLWALASLSGEELRSLLNCALQAYHPYSRMKAGSASAEEPRLNSRCSADSGNEAQCKESQVRSGQISFLFVFFFPSNNIPNTKRKGKVAI